MQKPLYKGTLTIDNNTYEIENLCTGSGGINPSYSIENNCGFIYAKKVINGALFFSQRDVYDVLYPYFQDDEKKCNDVSIDVYRICGSDYKLLASAVFAFKDIEDIETDNCRIITKLRCESKESCLIESWNEVCSFYHLPKISTQNESDGVEPFSSVTGTSTDNVNTFIPLISVNGFTDYEQNTQNYVPIINGNVTTQYPIGWWVQNTSTFINESNNTATVETKYIRECLTLPLGQTPVTDGWILLDANTNKYVRCPQGGESLQDLNHTRSLCDLLDFLISKVDKIDCFASHFLSCGNPTGVRPDNPQYQYAYDNFICMTIATFSDVLLPNTTNEATEKAYRLTLKQVIENLTKNIPDTYFFLSEYEDENGETKCCLQYEHLTFNSLTQNVTDLTDFDLAKQYDFNQKEIKYPVTLLPKVLDIKRYTNYSDSKGLDSSQIIRKDCTVDDVDDCEIELFTNSIGEIQGGNFEDRTGFVLVSNVKDNEGNFYINNNNESLSFRNLLLNLKTHDYFGSFCIDGIEVQTKNKIHSITLENKICLNIDCSDGSGWVNKLIKFTDKENISLGLVQSAELRYGCKVDLTLLVTC